MLDVRKIKPEMTYSLRHKILRPHQPIEEVKYDTDHNDLAFNVGAFYHGELITVASFSVDNNPNFPSAMQYSLRAMATSEDYRMLGAGRTVVTFAEGLIKEQGFDYLWCNARTSVQDYYQKLGFVTHGEVFDYPPIGPHIVMYKKLG